MAVVFRAYDPRFRREVAIKVLPPGFARNHNLYQRFEREAQVAAALEHPHIVPVYDYGVEEGQPYLVMRYMPGGTLAERLQQGPLSLTEATRIVGQIAAALEVAHQRGVIHRDLKPANILFDQFNQAYLSDFGIAKLADTSGLTQTGIAIGTPAYMSAEQAAGERDIDGRSDIYSLGTVFFEMLTGRVPYEAQTSGQVIAMHVSAPIPRIAETRPDMPAACQAVIEKALAKRPQDRYSQATELAAAVSELASPIPPAAVVRDTTPAVRSITPPIAVPPGLPGPTRATPPPSVRPSTQRQPALLWFGGIGLILLFVLAAWLLGGRPLFGGLRPATNTPSHTATVVASSTPRPPDPTTTATTLPTNTPRPTPVSPTVTPPLSSNATPTLQPSPTLAASPTTAAIISTAAPTRAPSPTPLSPTATAVSPATPPAQPSPPTNTPAPASTPTSTPAGADTPTSTPAS